MRLHYYCGISISVLAFQTQVRVCGQDIQVYVKRADRGQIWRTSGITHALSLYYNL